VPGSWFLVPSAVLRALCLVPRAVPGAVSLVRCPWFGVLGSVCLVRCAWFGVPRPVCLVRCASSGVPRPVCLVRCALSGMPCPVCLVRCASSRRLDPVVVSVGRGPWAGAPSRSLIATSDPAAIHFPRGADFSREPPAHRTAQHHWVLVCFRDRDWVRGRIRARRVARQSALVHLPGFFCWAGGGNPERLPRDAAREQGPVGPAYAAIGRYGAVAP
jgi:hypothetical protein